MRRVFVSAFAVAGVSLLSAQSAIAADMPIKASPMAPIATVYSWTGFYVGADLGIGWSKKDWDNLLGFPNSVITTNATGVLAGGQVGYNHQIGAFVLGIEGQWDWANLKGSSDCQNPAATCEARIDSIASITGRVGYAWDRTLVYVKGGGAWVHDKYNAFFKATPAVAANASETRGGAVVGVGLEYAFLANWSARVEYDYYALGTRNVTFSDGSTLGMKENLQTVRLGINYKFGGR